MPRIRKKTSNRTKIFDRVKLKKKVKETKRKKVKAAKKNPQWKSKSKDPGIPNEFPYKDQILAEVAEQRRLEVEEKEAKKEAKKLAREQARGIQRPGTTEGESPENNDEEAGIPSAVKKDLNVGLEAIQGLSAKVISGHAKSRPAPEVQEQSEDEDEDEAPALVNRDLPSLKAVLDVSDVLLQVIDARDPLEYRSQHLETVAKERGMQFGFVLTKIDACPREAVSAWLSHLRSQYPTFLFRSATAFLPPSAVTSQPVKKGKGKFPATDALGAETLLGYLNYLATEKKGDAPLTVAIAGVTNTGKSSFINSLAGRSALPVYSLSDTSRGASTTELPQEVEIEASGKQIRVIDTPGLSFEHDQTAEDKHQLRGRDILLRSRGRIDKLKDPSPPVSYIVSRAKNEDLMLLYNLAAFAKDDPKAFLAGVARSNQLVKRKGELDLAGASRIVLRDWSVGKFSRYAIPIKLDQPSSSSSLSCPEAWLASLYDAGDEAILSTLTPRQEFRKTTGMVRFGSGSVDDRNVLIDQEWAALEAEKTAAAEDEEDNEEGFGMEWDEEDGSEDEDDNEETSEEDSEVAPVTEPKKRKRGENPPLKSPPSKKVAFASSKGKKPLEISSKSKSGFVPSSILKKKAAPAPAPARPAKKKQVVVPPTKVANATSKRTREAEAGTEAYNFSQFF